MWKFSLNPALKLSHPFPLRKNKGKVKSSERYFCIDLHEDLVIELLSRLPLKSLARFKCVSKLWQRLISNTILVKNRPKLLLSSNFLGNSLFHSLDYKTRVDTVHLLPGHAVKVHSSCYGLLLIQVDTKLCVWNPLTQFFRYVVEDRYLLEGNTFLDLCFDYAKDRYKVLFVIEEHFYVVTCGGRYSTSIYVPDWVCNPHYGPFFKRFRHLICKGNGDYPNRIAYFDPRTNNFVQVPTPQPKNGVQDTIVGLGVLDGCLCMTRWDDQQIHEGKIEFLAMKEYGNEESWEIMLVISVIPQFRRYYDVEPLFVTEYGEILVCIQISNMHRIVRAYDVHGSYLWDLMVPSFGKCFLSSILYEESWFSPTRNNCKEWNYPYDSRSDSYLDCDYYEFFWWKTYINFALWEIESPFGEKISLRKKNRNKKMEKKSHLVKITNSEFYKRSYYSSFEIETRRKGRKRNKRNYEPKYGNSQRFQYL